MTENSAWLRKIVVGMLAMIEPAAWRIEGSDDIFDVALGGMRIAFAASGPAGASLERLASAIEARMAFERARAMLAATGTESEALPLWLVTGSSVLAAWLDWSRSETVFRRRLALSGEPGLAPVSGTLDRPMRRSLGQAAARIRVRSGFAIAERIELPDRLRCTASFAKEARIRIEGGPLPETIVVALTDEPRRNDRRRAADIVDHPFIAAADLRLAGIRNEGDAIVMEMESSWGPLAPVPKAAWQAVPNDADPTCPWSPTAREVRALYALVDEGRRYREDG